MGILSGKKNKKHPANAMTTEHIHWNMFGRAVVVTVALRKVKYHENDQQEL